MGSWGWTHPTHSGLPQCLPKETLQDRAGPQVGSLWQHGSRWRDAAWMPSTWLSSNTLCHL